MGGRRGEKSGEKRRSLKTLGREGRVRRRRRGMAWRFDGWGRGIGNDGMYGVSMYGYIYLSIVYC